MAFSRPHMLLGLALMAAGAILLLVQQGCQPNERRTASTTGESKSCCESESPCCGQSKCQPADKKPQPSPATKTWKSLFDGKTLAGWKAPQFGGEGKVYVEQGVIVMEIGSDMTGVTWTGDVIRNNYELELEGMKIDGTDFFCTTTFPVGKDYCSLVVGGWGGGLVGLSSIDGHDASENSTSTHRGFKKNRWYRVRIRVTDAAIEAWIDDEQVVRQSREGHKFSIRSEVNLCRPLGISTWITKGAVRNIRVRPLEGKSG
jgi:hypothetical protein